MEKRKKQTAAKHTVLLLPKVLHHSRKNKNVHADARRDTHTLVSAYPHEKEGNILCS